MFQDLLEKLAGSLDRHGISYMLIGGQAVLLYGEPRLTRDIDITLGLGPDKVSDVMKIVRNMGCKVLVESPETFVSKTMVLPCSEPSTDITIDFIFSFSPYERQALKRVKRVRIGKTHVCFASVEDLVIHKIIAGRPRDIDDVKNVLFKNKNIDAEYIRKWLVQFEESLLKNFLTQFEELWKASRE